MDEAKLKSIELDLQDKYGNWPSRSDLQDIIDAFRHERERAARAETERDLRDDVRGELEQLRTMYSNLREAAEAFANDDLFERDLDDRTIICVTSGVTEAMAKLRAALAAAKDPAR